MKPLIATMICLMLFSCSAAHAHDPHQAGNNNDDKFIALTFDDGPDAQTTPALLDVLKKYNAKATFFVMSNRIDANASILKRMVGEGHALGNHTLSHSRLSDLSSEAIRTEIEGASNLIQRASGVTPDVLRPPYGATNAAVINTARTRGLAIVLWSIYPDDASYFTNATTIAERVVSSASNGDIVFMHDTSQRSVEATELTLRELSAKGFHFVTVPELITQQGKLVPGAIYKTAHAAE